MDVLRFSLDMYSENYENLIIIEDLNTEANQERLKRAKALFQILAERYVLLLLSYAKLNFETLFKLTI